MSAASLPLRDVQLPPPPGWWPPAPGWWLLAGALLLLVLLAAGWHGWRLRRRRRWQRMFASECGAGTPSERVAAMSALLRRAARRACPGSEQLQGEAWLAWLDGEGTAFTQGEGRLLLDGPFRPGIEQASCERVTALAQARFVALMERRR
ncbi:DUF4381 family protein [Xanthomonas sp. XNM01]|uniref:DUF4381 family protein n=1 Tax=Xanthomonas sp. XNM01 TaxID=2769289 RepID=UPI001CE09353|nr:DUF4381 family protein [Xanthomonas sp. XNM01]